MNSERHGGGETEQTATRKHPAETRGIALKVWTMALPDAHQTSRGERPARACSGD